VTADKLRAALELLPAGTLLTLSRDELLEALVSTPIASDDRAVALPVSDEWLTAEQTAARLGVSDRWCYDHADQLGVRRLSRRCVRFSARAVDRFMTKRRTV